MYRMEEHKGRKGGYIGRKEGIYEGRKEEWW
jgi:hypothetical protein